MPAFTVVTLDQRPDLIDIVASMGGSPDAWPEFMLHDPVADKHFWRLYDTFPHCQVVVLDEAGQIAGMGNTIPVTWDGTLAVLPDEGWDAILLAGVNNFRAGITADTLSAIQAVVAPRYKSQGVSQQIVRAMKGVAAKQGLNALVAPVRPNLKHRYPLTPIERYIQWTQADGTLFDPWLRTHARLGATILKVCPHSMTISGTVAEWEQWTGMRFPESGSYVVTGALVPVEINCETDVGRYVEPNVWMVHKVAVGD